LSLELHHCCLGHGVSTSSGSLEGGGVDPDATAPREPGNPVVGADWIHTSKARLSGVAPLQDGVVIDIVVFTFFLGRMLDGFVVRILRYKQLWRWRRARN